MEFSHFDDKGNARMVDISMKDITDRIAVASGCISMSGECYKKVKEGTVKKGDVLGVARIAGIMAAKRTFELIPLCHAIGLTKLEIEFEMSDEEHTISAICTAQATGKTGVEMEALTGVNIALLTIYDMCKAVDKSMVMGQICLLEKNGGKSGHYERLA